MTAMISRNTTIPTEYLDIFTTSEDDQDNVIIKVFQGERPQTKNNIFLGEFKLEDIPLAPRGVPQIEVKFDIDANGIVSVSAKDLNTEKIQNITISGKSSLTAEEIEKILSETKSHIKEDREFQEISDEKLILNEKLIQIDTILRNMEQELNVGKKNKLKTMQRSLERIIDKSNNIDEIIETKEKANVLIKSISSFIYAKADKMFQDQDDEK
jgi:molecular chaperone DnaK